MANADSILELLDDIFPNAYCDDCLSGELGIQPRQQVNQIGRRLESMGKTVRQRGTCSSCNKNKTINKIIRSDLASQPTQNSKAVHESQTLYNVSVGTPIAQHFDIEHARTEVVKLCHNVWKEHKQNSPPHSISEVINSLKNENILPSHQANMMLTLCNLRNVYVYENMQLGLREINIAENALSIIQEWWISVKK